MKPGPTENVDAGETLQVFREVNGSIPYIPLANIGTDWRPHRMTGHGEVRAILVPQGSDPKTPVSPIVDEVLFTLDGLSKEQVEAAREAISGLVEEGQEVTRDAVMAKLSEQ